MNTILPRLLILGILLLQHHLNLLVLATLPQLPNRLDLRLAVPLILQQYFYASLPPPVLTHQLHIPPPHGAPQRRLHAFLVHHTPNTRVSIPLDQKLHHAQIAVYARQVQSRPPVVIDYLSHPLSSFTAVDQLSRVPILIKPIRVLIDQILHRLQICLHSALHRLKPRLLPLHLFQRFVPHFLVPNIFLLLLRVGRDYALHALFSPTAQRLREGHRRGLILDHMSLNPPFLVLRIFLFSPCPGRRSREHLLPPPGGISHGSDLSFFTSAPTTISTCRQWRIASSRS